MRRIIGICLVLLLCLSVTLPAHAATGATLTTSFSELVSRWIISLVLATKDGSSPESSLEVGSTMDPNG